MIKVTAQSTYLPEQSYADGHRFLWSYEVTVTNESDQIVQLLNRYWRITDMSGYVEEVRGPGVVGLQPIMKPGKIFTYTSFCQLSTPQGTMEGHYEMQSLDEEHYVIEIPKFVLTSPVASFAGFRSRLH